jgi:hypothetical protein
MGSNINANMLWSFLLSNPFKKEVKGKILPKLGTSYK